jgi:hypothetical protein
MGHLNGKPIYPAAHLDGPGKFCSDQLFAGNYGIFRIFKVLRRLFQTQ